MKRSLRRAFGALLFGLLAWYAWEKTPDVFAEKAKVKKFWHTRPKGQVAPQIQVYNFSPLVKRVKPAVFNLFVEGKLPKPRRSYRDRNKEWRFFDRWPWERGPSEPFSMPRPPLQKQQFFPFRRYKPRRSRGSGFLINADGYALTNYHVVRNAGKIRASLEDGRQFQVKVIGTAPEIDVALIHLQAKGKEKFPYAYLGNSSKTEVGEPVLAIGNARGLGLTVTAGIISAKGRVLGSGQYDNYIQTDAAINFGNSGGPLFNREGDVIGINTAILRGGRGIGFAVPINMVRRILLQLRSKGHIDRAQLGVEIQQITENHAQYFGLDRPKGALISKVVAGSPAQRAGLQAGDIILSFNQQEIRTYSDLPRLVAFSPIGSKAKLGILRNGKRMTLIVVLRRWGNVQEADAGSDPFGPQKAPGKPSNYAKALKRLGVGVASVDEALRTRWKLPSKGGIRLSSVRPASTASENGLRKGDVILEINRTKIKDPVHFMKLLSSIPAGENVLLLVRREENALFLAFPLP
ncbi:MAG: trypsin-like peptidase domain-containing protein [Myxococcales bacterium]|nr:trypsin-like peptidase domain-containing protein [Myxococcales bacterium]